VKVGKSAADHKACKQQVANSLPLAERGTPTYSSIPRCDHVSNSELS